MRDYDFGDAEVNQGYWTRAAIRASYLPLVEPALFRTGDTLAMRRVVTDRWRDLLEKLRGVGWPLVQDDLRYFYARNCPPADALFDLPLKFCKFNHICPHCWSRELVYPNYDRLLAACFDGKKVRPDMHLVDLHRTWRIERAEGCFQLFLYQMRFPHREEYRRREVDLLQARGALVVHACHLTLKHLVIRRSILALVRDPQRWPRELGDLYRHEITTITKRGDLVSPLARVCRYPKQLFECGPLDLCQFLVAAQHAKLVTAYGNLRLSHIER